MGRILAVEWPGFSVLERSVKSINLKILYIFKWMYLLPGKRTKHILHICMKSFRIGISDELYTVEIIRHQQPLDKNLFILKEFAWTLFRQLFAERSTRVDWFRDAKSKFVLVLPATESCFIIELFWNFLIQEFIERKNSKREKWNFCHHFW